MPDLSNWGLHAGHLTLMVWNLAISASIPLEMNGIRLNRSQASIKSIRLRVDGITVTLSLIESKVYLGMKRKELPDPFFIRTVDSMSSDLDSGFIQ